MNKFQAQVLGPQLFSRLHMQRNDAWSSFVSDTLSSIGVTPQQREIADKVIAGGQTFIDQRKSAEVIPAGSQVGSVPMEPNPYFEALNENKMLIIGGVVVVGLAMIIFWRKS